MKVNELIKKLDELKEQLQKVPGDTIIHTDGRDNDKEYHLAVRYKGYFEPTGQVEEMSENCYDYFIENRADFPDHIELLLRANDEYDY